MLDHKGRANLSRKHTEESQVHLSSILPQASTHVQKVSWDTEQLPIWETWLPLDNSEQFYQLTDWQKHPHHDLQMKHYMPRSSSPWANLDRQKPVAKKFQDVVLNLAKTKDSSSHTSDIDKGHAVQHLLDFDHKFFHGRRHGDWHGVCFTGYQKKNNQASTMLPTQATYFLAQARGSQSQRYLSSWFFFSFTIHAAESAG